ncbi:hypothetical protein CEXT_577251 [Caerostris extrusa]|uniref:Uncharacterized protein n=1 Tax=Caerostris extrusa TaxID=172846 RepID=A0AAV4PBV3_CAEEX|nr:hypothetical protein CEXT_577251 [Caerostris extrusa]
MDASNRQRLTFIHRLLQFLSGLETILIHKQLNSSPVRIFFDNSSGIMFHGHLCYTTTCGYFKQSTAKHQQIWQLHSSYGYGYG